MVPTVLPLHEVRRRHGHVALLAADVRGAVERAHAGGGRVLLGALEVDADVRSAGQARPGSLRGLKPASKIARMLQITVNS